MLQHELLIFRKHLQNLRLLFPAGKKLFVVSLGVMPDDFSCILHNILFASVIVFQIELLSLKHRFKVNHPPRI